jgi:membrane protease YdiL (CAAX protease family)
MLEPKQRRALLAVLGLVTLLLAGPPLAFVGYATYQRGIGLNQETVVLGLTTLALVAVFWLWISEGRKVTNKTEPERPERIFGFGSLKYRLLGFLLGLLGIAIGIIYVEYIEPYFVNR